MAEDKEYEGTISLGVTTSTQDKEGDVLEQKPVPALTREQVEVYAARKGMPVAEIERWLAPNLGYDV